jgi:hypothetical protein
MGFSAVFFFSTSRGLACCINPQPGGRCYNCQWAQEDVETLYNLLNNNNNNNNNNNLKWFNKTK